MWGEEHLPFMGEIMQVVVLSTWFKSSYTQESRRVARRVPDGG